MSPLTKRFPRELRNNLGKYLGIFLLMSVSIALTSGFLLAANSISTIIDDMPETYAIEDGRFTTAFEASEDQLEAVRDAAASVGGVAIYENYSFDADFKKSEGDDGRGKVVRAYEHRTQIDLAAYAEGDAPQAADEIAIDRVFAANNDIGIGDAVTLNGREFTVVGIMTTADNQALFQNNSDFTVNTLGFGVAELSERGFEALASDGYEPDYTYSYRFGDRDLTLAERTDVEKDMVSALSDAGAHVNDLIDVDSNQAIGYAADDVEGDSSMWITLLYIIIAIMAFVFVVLTSGTIEEESAVIGTLLASGYRRRELILHYLALPSVVGIVAAALGNVVGYTAMSQPMQELYYGSYSLPPYYATWSWGVFAQTTVVPIAVLIGITLLGLIRKMGHTPLQFLRHETSKGGVKRGFALPERLSFTARFRLRVFLRNLGNFVTLFFGIGFASMLLLFSLAIMPTMTHYAENLRSNVAAQHLYSLKAPLELEGTQDQRDSWAAIEKLRDVEADKLTAAEDAADDMQERADALQAAADELQASPSLDAMQKAQDAKIVFDDAQDALYDALDAIAADLGMTRDDVLDLVDDASEVDADDDDVHPMNTVDNGQAKIEQAEKYAVYSLEYDRGGDSGNEPITVYGISEDSRYWQDMNVGDGSVVFGGGLIDKFGFESSQQIDLYDKYEDKTYTVVFGGDGFAWGSKSNMSIYMSLDDFNEMFGNDAAYFNGYASDEALQLDSRYVASTLTPADMDAIGDQFVNMMDGMIGMLLGLSVFIFLVLMYLLTKSVIDRSARSISYMKVFGYRDGEVSRLYVRSITWCVAVSLIVCQPAIISALTLIFKSMLMDYSGNIEIFVPMACIVETILIGFATYVVVALLHVRHIKKVPLALALKSAE